MTDTATGRGWEMRRVDSLVCLRDLVDGSVDAVITDPPYSSGGQYRGDRQAKPSTKYQQSDTEKVYPEFFGDSRDQRGYLAWCSLWLAEAWRVARDGAALAVFSDWRMLPTITDAVQAGGWVWRGVLPWCKPAHRPQMGRFAAGAEFVVWGSRGAMPTDRGVPVLPGFLVVNPPQSDDRVHMTEKPIEVMRDIVRLAQPGGLVLDPFAGSGTTGVAAVVEGRRFLGFELSAEYFEIAQSRLCAAEDQVSPKDRDAGQLGLFSNQGAA